MTQFDLVEAALVCSVPIDKVRRHDNHFTACADNATQGETDSVRCSLCHYPFDSLQCLHICNTYMCVCTSLAHLKDPVLLSFIIYIKADLNPDHGEKQVLYF